MTHIVEIRKDQRSAPAPSDRQIKSVSIPAFVLKLLGLSPAT